MGEQVGMIKIHLEQRILQAFDATENLVFHAPVSIAREVAKRPVGELAIEVRVADPNYTFNPAILTATAAREGITEKFVIQPGPNNPVGTVWLGLNRPSYGIHGTPVPEKVGRTESSGCFRLANWNARALLEATEVGTPVQVLP
jgi:lipoprotein-anchoring transpeptidase ErfK/SrfK